MPATFTALYRNLWGILFLCLICLKPASAQQSNRDSLQNQQLEEATELLKQKEQGQTLDSLKRQALLEELETLKTNEIERKKALEQRLRELEKEDSLKREKQRKQIEALRKTAKGFAVAPFGDTLFLIYTAIGSLNAQERAHIIAQRIEKLAGASAFSADSLQLRAAESGFVISYRGDVVQSITETDGLWHEQAPEVLAKNYLGIIKSAVLAERERNSLRSILTEVALTIVLLIGVYVIIYLINKLFRWARFKLFRSSKERFRGVRIKNYQLFDGEQQLNFFLMLSNIVRILSIVLATYLALPLLFSIFPQTKNLADVLLGWILAPALKIIKGIINYLPNLFTIVVIFLFTHYVVRFVRFLAHEVDRGALVINGFYQDWAMPTFNVLRFLLYAFMFVVVFPYLPGSDSAIFQGVSVFLGILFSLGSSSAIANAVAGLVLTYMRPFKVGDRIKIGDLVGDVVEKDLLVTRIRTPKNEDITIPNASILSGHTINYTSACEGEGLIVHTTVTIGYDVPWKEVHAALIEAASRNRFVLATPKPFVLQTSLDDFYVAYQLNAYTKAAKSQSEVYSELHQHIQDVFNERGIEILSPHYRAMRDGNMVTIPAAYLPADYQAPPFRVLTEQEKRP
jgi:small-conductance mechanosensitive channel